MNFILYIYVYNKQTVKCIQYTLFYHEIHLHFYILHTYNIIIDIYRITLHTYCTYIRCLVVHYSQINERIHSIDFLMKPLFCCMSMHHTYLHVIRLI